MGATPYSAMTLGPMRDPSWVLADGPGTVVSVHLLDVPFGGTRFVVMFKTDRGQLIEVWHPGNPPQGVVTGIYGTLLYSRNPEKVVAFHVLPRK
jgi:hypothetical protein